MVPYTQYITMAIRPYKGPYANAIVIELTQYASFK